MATTSKWQFGDLAKAVSTWCGRASTFFAACFVIVIWGILGPFFHFSDTWQLIINTGTTIITFLVVFLIQNTQNRDIAAIHLKLDELIRSVDKARNEVAAAETLPDVAIESLKVKPD
jgi:low affinity Fe/Cu permease